MTEGHLSADSTAQHRLRRLARSGANVLILDQPGLDNIVGLPRVQRAPPEAFTWRQRHPLLRQLDEKARSAWLHRPAQPPAQAPPLVGAIKLDPDEPGLVVAGWPEELAGAAKQAPRYGAVVTRTLGEGRLVFWQSRLDDWGADPRNQQLLLNAVDYLLTEPAPTPPPAQRQPEKTTATTVPNAPNSC